MLLKSTALSEIGENGTEKYFFTCFVFKELMFTLLDTRREEERLKAW
jgi:hypothetical protein